MIDLNAIYTDLGKAVKGICTKVYPKNRPKSMDKTIDSYIVVFVPSDIFNNEISDNGAYNDYSAIAQIEIYVRDKVTASSPNGFMLSNMSEKVKKVMDIFPIKTTNISVTKPKVTMQADDGDGFSVVIIQANLRTR
jgi:hypothetical protein